MKQIIFCRCSTDKQEVESQLIETKQYAISLGYSENDFIYISSVGASAVKLNELYMQTIQQLKNYILSGEVNAVVCWHINRLARNDIIAMELKELFISCRVQLHIKEPSISLLNVDGSVFEFYYYGRYKHKIYADKEHLEPLYFPTIEHHNETFIVSDIYNAISKKKR